MNKLTRAQSIAIAQAARKIPEGVTSDRVYLQIPSDKAAQMRRQSPIERGQTYTLGLAVEQGGYLLLYDLIEALGGRIVTTIVDKQLTIVTRHKTYEGNNQAELLLQILRDRLEALTVKEYDDEDSKTQGGQCGHVGASDG